MTIDELAAVLANELEYTLQDAKQSEAIDMNCYGAGYDRGYVNGLERALRLLRGEDEDL